MLSFRDKKILIIGASSGIGEKAAYLLSKQGATVILTARRKEKLEAVCNSIGEKACWYETDISDIGKTKDLFSRIAIDHGPLDGMAYVAGIDEDIPLKYLEYERIRKIFDTNYFGFIESVRQATKRGRYNKGMRIVAVSSIVSSFGQKAHTAYAGSKGAMDASIRCMAKELSNKGICINSIAPSMVRTEMYKRVVNTYSEENETNQSVLNRQYLGLAETTDVANAIIYLLSEEARYITGITMPVDGGFSTSC